MSGRRTLCAGAACVALLLAACGGAEPEGAPPPRTLAAAPVVQDDHQAATQRLYLAYLGRAADPAGLAFYSGASREAGAPAAGALYGRYGADPALRRLLDSLAASPEALALHGPDSGTAVTAMYRNLFNREPDSAGQAYWSGMLSSAALTRGQAPAALLAAAHPLDLAVFERKAAVAGAFTAALDTPERLAHYQGSGAAAALRQVLGKVTAATSAAQEQALVAEAMAAVAASPAFPKVEAIVRARCVACHSATPTMRGFPTAPRGIRFDTPEQIRADARRIYVNVVQTEFMPYGNQTGMTPAERELVRVWYTAGAL